MHDGTPFEVHPCLELDPDFTSERLREELRKGIESLSVRSRWQRFFTPIHELTEDQLDRLTDLDGINRVAWYAVIPHKDDIRGIGISRYVRLADEPGVAEFAVTVIDEFQGQGVGRALMQKLIGTASENGIYSLRGYVLPGNRGMLNLCKRLKSNTNLQDKVIRAEISVPGTGRDDPGATDT